jgi:hypothetical protein
VDQGVEGIHEEIIKLIFGPRHPCDSHGWVNGWKLHKAPLEVVDKVGVVETRCVVQSAILSKVVAAE